MSTFTSNSRDYTPSNLTAQQAYDAHMTTLPAKSDVLVLLACALDHRAQRYSALVTDQAAVVQQTNTDMSELHDIMSMFNTALGSNSSATDTTPLALFTGSQTDANAKAALLNKWLAPTQVFAQPQSSGSSTYVINMNKSVVTSSNQNLQLTVDDKTSESQAEQTRAQSFMNKYSAVIEAASSSEKKGSDLMLSIIASLASTG